ncbi:MAG: acyloxyacyl hydrolase [Cytophagales bacterium]
MFSLRIVLLIILFGCSLDVSSQNLNESPRPVYIGVKTHLSGIIIPHRDTLRQIASSRPRGLQIEISRYNISEKSWRSCNCYARTGFSFMYFDYGNRDQLGQSYNLAFFLEPYFNVNNRLNFSYRASMALSYLNKPYDENSNPENLFYSSALSYMLNVSMHANYNLKPNLILNGGLFYNHISNGGMKQPNLGMNFPTIALGLDYVLKPLSSDLTKYQKPDEFNRELKYYMRMIASLKTIEAFDSNMSEVQRPVFGIEAGVIKPVSKLNALLIGCEYISDGSWKLRNKRWGEDFDHRTFNIMAGHGFLLGRFMFSQQLGLYAYKDYPNTSSIFYQRYALFYQLGNYLNIGFSMKTHLEVAEIMDVRIGTTF